LEDALIVQKRQRAPPDSELGLKKRCKELASEVARQKDTITALRQDVHVQKEEATQVSHVTAIVHQG
jgi:uncharacterized coiled-coil protein SlyX